MKEVKKDSVIFRHSDLGMDFLDSCFFLCLILHSDAPRWQVEGCYTALASFGCRRHRTRYKSPTLTTQNSPHVLTEGGMVNEHFLTIVFILNSININ